MYYTTGHGEATFSDSVTKLFSKNNLTTGEIPDDCDLLFMDAPSKDISDDEKTLLLNYLKKGGKVFIILGDSEDETPNLDEVLKEYGMQEADGYIADMQRSYQGNYYYIFPEITATDDLANNLESEMVLIHWEQSQPSRSHPTIRPTAVLPKTARLMRQRPAV